MNQTTIYIGIAVVVLIVIIVAVMMSRKKTQVKTETKTEVLSCNLGYEIQNGECKFVACPSGFYNDINEKKCKRRTKVCLLPQRACETVTENPNADECITDISRCCKEDEFEYNGQCRTDCPNGTIVSGKKCIAGNCPTGFYRSETDKGGKYRDSKGICRDYNNAFIRYKQNYLTDANKQCKNVVFNPNADDITITNKQGSSCSLNEGESGRCDNGECKFAGCAQGFFDKGNRNCERDCSGNGTNNINNTVNRTCVSSCPANTYYNKIMNGATVVKNECVSDCSSVVLPNIFGVNVPQYNFVKGDKKYCISCLQDVSINRNSPQIERDTSADKYVDVYSGITISDVTLSKERGLGNGTLYINFVSDNCVKRN